MLLCENRLTAISASENHVHKVLVVSSGRFYKLDVINIDICRFFTYVKRVLKIPSFLIFGYRKCFLNLLDLNNVAGVLTSTLLLGYSVYVREAIVFHQLVIVELILFLNHHVIPSVKILIIHVLHISSMKIDKPLLGTCVFKVKIIFSLHFYNREKLIYENLETTEGVKD